MKFFSKQLFSQLYYFIFTLLIFSSFYGLTYSLNLKQDPQFFNEDPEMADSNRTPLINIHMEDHDSDPINFRRFDGERKNYSLRVHELEALYENEKKALSDVIALQQSKIANLIEIADSTNRIMDFLIPEDRAKGEKSSIDN